jgi:DNA-binding transcriptional ArsR family regulator
MPKRRTDRPSKNDICNVPCFKAELVDRLRRAMPPNQAIEEARKRFAVLADGQRLRILLALTEADELCVCDVAHVIGMTVAATSHHLRKLRDLGILRHRNDGKMAYYALADRFLARLGATMTRKVAA